MKRLSRFVRKILGTISTAVVVSALTVLVGCDRIVNGVRVRGDRVVGYAQDVPDHLDLTEYDSIAAGAFRNCRKLKSVKLPMRIKRIEEGTFAGCSDQLFDTKTIPGVKLVDGWAVAFNSSLSGNVDLTGVRGIADGAFRRCMTLTGVTIGDQVRQIGEGAFADCKRLKSVVIGCGVAKIDQSIFPGCRQIENFSVSEDNPELKSDSGLLLTKDGGTLVYGVNGDVVIPDSVTHIKAGAFQNCPDLTSVTIPDSIEEIDDGAFSGCSGLTNVVIGARIAKMSKRLFLSGLKIENFGVSEKNPHFKSVSGMLLTKDGKTLVCGVGRSVVIPEGVEEISPEAFRNCAGLTDVTIPDGVKRIGRMAFADCGDLTNVVIGKCANKIGRTTFLNCPKIENFVVSEENPHVKSVSRMLLTKDGETLIHGVGGECVIPDGVFSIEQEAFFGCSGLCNVIIPDSVQSVGDMAFGNCGNLTSVEIGKNACGINRDTFLNCREIARFVVSKENTYYKATPEGLKTKNDNTLICGVARTGEHPSTHGRFMLFLVRHYLLVLLAVLLVGGGVAWLVIWRGKRKSTS